MFNMADDFTIRVLSGLNSLNKTERFCAAADRNIVLTTLAATHLNNDKGNAKVCSEYSACKSRDNCKFVKKIGQV